MSDGNEERKERELRKEQQQREDREDWVGRDDIDEAEPERGGS